MAERSARAMCDPRQARRRRVPHRVVASVGLARHGSLSRARLGRTGRLPHHGFLCARAGARRGRSRNRCGAPWRLQQLGRLRGRTDRPGRRRRSLWPRRTGRGCASRRRADGASGRRALAVASVDRARLSTARAATMETAAEARRVRAGAAAGGASWRNTGTAFLFLLPSATVFALFVFYPLAKSVYLSFFANDLLGQPIAFVGLEQYQTLVTDPYFGNVMLTTVYFVILTVIPSVLIGLGLALLVRP